jgi:hypothetical protein
MLLGSPPDMVHGVALHRNCAHKQKFSFSFSIHAFKAKIKGQSFSKEKKKKLPLNDFFLYGIIKKQ